MQDYKVFGTLENGNTFSFTVTCDAQNGLNLAKSIVARHFMEWNLKYYDAKKIIKTMFVEKVGA
jgi:hypothetical protein|tara:strand:+ start:603 stop:794 length:192 start_codon:yes stop_codon:yes gene_type:complete